MHNEQKLATKRMVPTIGRPCAVIAGAAAERVATMFLDVRDEWPPVPPPTPLPESKKSRLGKRGERIVGLIVAINLGLLLLAPIAGSSVVRALAAVFNALHR
jgi:hypothetical protein